MAQGTLPPNSAEVKLVSLQPTAGTIEMHLRVPKRRGLSFLQGKLKPSSQPLCARSR